MKTEKAYGITWDGELIIASIHETEHLAKQWIEADRWAAWDLLVGKRKEPLGIVELSISYHV